MDMKEIEFSIYVPEALAGGLSLLETVSLLISAVLLGWLFSKTYSYTFGKAGQKRRADKRAEKLRILEEKREIDLARKKNIAEALAQNSVRVEDRRVLYRYRITFYDPDYHIFIEPRLYKSVDGRVWYDAKDGTDCRKEMTRKSERNEHDNGWKWITLNDKLCRFFDCWRVKNDLPV